MRTGFYLFIVLTLCGVSAHAEEWMQFRGPGGQGISSEKSLPVKWSSTENIVWKVDLPGPGASCPIVVKDRIYLTAYTGYGIENAAGDQNQLRRHLLCFARNSGKSLWSKEFFPKLPEHQYQGEGAYHGYAASTPVSDGERLYVFFGKSGVYCFDLDGNELWNVSVGDGLNGWGSGCSPILYENLVIINASVESGSLVALDKKSGSEVWRQKEIRSAWNTPIIVAGKERPELIVSTEPRLMSFNPIDGTPLWNADGIHRYVCPSVVAHDGVVYAIGGGHTSLAVRTGGSGDVTASHTVWRQPKGSNVGSPIYLDGHLYWAHESNGTFCCQKAATGETVFQERLEPRPGNIWSSLLLADGKFYMTAQNGGTYVVAAKPSFELLAFNKFDDDQSRTNATPATHQGQLLLRTERRLYCIGKR